MKPSEKDVLKPAARKPYNRPQLQVYGDLREITNTSTNEVNAKKSDDAHGNSRTH